MKRILCVAIVALFLTSCGDSAADRKQYEFGGGTFTIALDNDPTTFIARDITDVYSATVLHQVGEGLVKLNAETLEPEACLAKSWEVSADGLTYTFDLRDDVYFHDHEIFGGERKFTPADVIYTIELGCSKTGGTEENYAYKTIYKDVVKGAKEFHNGEADNVSGVKVNGNKLTIELLDMDGNFLNKLTAPNAMVVAKEIVEAGKETDMVGTGPFKFTEYVQGAPSKIILVKNQKYYLNDADGNALPYLDSLVLIVENNKLEQLDMFENGNMNLISSLPPSRTTDLLSERMEDFNSKDKAPKFILHNEPSLSTQFYIINTTDPKFQDKRVRQALNYAVDRKAIVRNALNNQAYGAGTGGLVPPIKKIFKGYDFAGVKKVSYSFNPEKAQELMAEAGYPNGEGFPSINLKYNLGTEHSEVAKEFANHMKKYLNINVNIDGMTFEDKNNDQYMAKGDLFRTSWFADYSSPETFLQNAYGKSVPESLNEPSINNNARYVNPAYDEYFEKAKKANNIVDKYKYFAEAEKIMMEDAPYIILWYGGAIQIQDANVRNFNFNPMNFYDFRNVYIKQWTKEEYDAAQKEK